jgi:hypothetical protein
MAIVDRAGLPIAVHVASASPHEPHFVPATLDARFLADVPTRLIGDRGYDSAPRRYVHDYARHRNDCGQPPRPRADTRWPGRFAAHADAGKVERFLARLYSHRRVVTRWERRLDNYLGMVQLVCAWILLRRFMR